MADSGNRRIDEFTPWGLFVKSWGWGVADGTAELQTCGPAEPASTPNPNLCRAGIEGDGKGQFGSFLFSLAVDANGDVYVVDGANLRVQKFSPAGEFLLMFGGGVNKTTGANVCTEASGNECQKGSAGAAPGEFTAGVGIAITPAGNVLVGDEGRVQEFEPTGAFKGSFSVPGKVGGLTVDPNDADVYVLLQGKEDVYRFDATGTELIPKLSVFRPSLGSVTTDPNDGDVYAIKGAEEPHGEFPNGIPEEVVQFDSDGEALPRCCIPAELPSKNGSRFSLSGLGTNGAGDLYVANRSTSEGSFIAAFGPPPVEYEPPPEAPPSIDDQFLVEASASTASLKAKINPRFWDTTTYFVEYGLGKCSEGGCGEKAPVPAVALTKAVKNSDVTTEAVALAGLLPNTTYHYRFVARTLFKPGSETEAEVRGVGGKVGVDGAEASFVTQPTAEPLPPCPANAAFRTGPAANLAACRAYEMVSPVEKNNADIITLPDVTGYETQLNQSSVDGEALTYSSYRAFGGPEGGPYTAQYLARREAGGWSSEPLGGPLSGNFYNIAILDDEFKAFSADLCQSWLVPNAEPTLAPGAVEDFPNLYRRANCPKAYEVLTNLEPTPTRVAKKYQPELQGHSADASKAIFRVNANLGAGAPAQPAGCNPEGGLCQTRVYESSAGALKYVCVFPAGTPAKTEAEFPNCSAGSPGFEFGESANGRLAIVKNALSEDGSVIYWSASAQPDAFGRIYVRVNGVETLAVSETQTAKPARFWGAATDGSKALFTVEDPATPPTPKNKNLYLYDLEAQASSLVAGKVVAVLAASEDLTRVYFVSEEALGTANGEGKAAVKDQPNLYLHEGTTNTFVTTLIGENPGRLPSNVARAPVYHVPQTTADGARLAFVSNAPLTGFDNRDAASGEADWEVFSYDATSGKLACASCSPVGARPQGRSVRTPGVNQTVPTAAAIPTAETILYQPRVLSADGSKLFFTSYTPLLGADTNGKADVYEWQRAASSAECEDEADPDFYAANNGCLFLVSTGKSAQDSKFVDSSSSGRDVFFSTEESLAAQDPGLIDIYDARVGGGFPPPTAEPSACNPSVGACQSPGSPPGFQSPASSGPGEGNPKAIKCAKGKHRAFKRGTEVCVKKHKAKKHHKGKRRGGSK